ncbi:DNA cytosine methyltransferase [Rivularia sp. UHCC 0363]|uniref:DNA cytosine methyltransferase n=1 Tax=Rivularia sp. UHCC 0363 TaxID=3110244 RepID=UPI002B20F828|nr:DNA cytosine methyltransferase [Rivularia sp. UHCC 0363]MEA5594755.1 DNA cytosine methyltransferase [Rivularia sp. UHCC 0363]
MGTRKLRQLDLCSGIGGGFPLSGIITGKVQLCGLCEIDSFCKQILQKRFPGVPIYNSVRNLRIEKEPIDIITASPPCQPFSIEGHRRGEADERDCIPAVLRLVARIQPKFFCLENVPGLLSAPQYPGDKPGTYFQQMLRQLYAYGYDAEWVVIGTRFRFGTKWSGERLLFIATSRSVKLEWKRTTPWKYQIGSQGQENCVNWQEGSIQPRMARNTVWAANRLDIPPGVPSGNRVTRARRAVLGNCLDVRLAQIVWERVLYLYSLITI